MFYTETQEIKPRYEKKYLIDSYMKMKIMNYLKKFCQHDRNGKFGTYRVNSLYYDTSDLKNYYDGINGESNRQKVRLRYYNDFNKEVKFEIKKKVNDLSYKESFPCKIHTYTDICIRERDMNFVPLYLNGMIPQIFIQYTRTAFTSLSDLTNRITFDSELKFTLNNEGKLLINYPMAYEIMEVKFEKTNFWLEKLLKEVSRFSTSFSKYNKLLHYTGVYK